MKNNNMIVRLAMLRNAITNWRAAEIIGVSEATFYRMLRNELPQDEQERIASAIERAVLDHD